MTKYWDKSKKIYVAGHHGMVGSAIVRLLKLQGVSNIITRTHSELDLTDQYAVKNFFMNEKPTDVILAAAKVGGIHSNNTYPADFIYQNIMLQTNVVEASFRNGVQKLLFLGSSCIYPRMAKQPIREDALLTGPLEPTNEPYAIAKIAGIKLCESYNRQYGKTHGVDYRSIMPTNLYGPGDRYHPENSHVIPSLIHRFHFAKLEGKKFVEIWGSGIPKREFLYVDDLASACLQVMELSREDYYKKIFPIKTHINIGSGVEISIISLARKVANTVGYLGDIICDLKKPDGVQNKLIDSGNINSIGWQPRVELDKGLMLTYQDFLKTYAK